MGRKAALWRAGLQGSRHREVGAQAGTAMQAEGLGTLTSGKLTARAWREAGVRIWGPRPSKQINPFQPTYNNASQDHVLSLCF